MCQLLVCCRLPRPKRREFAKSDRQSQGNALSRQVHGVFGVCVFVSVCVCVCVCICQCMRVYTLTYTDRESQWNELSRQANGVFVCVYTHSHTHTHTHTHTHWS